MKQRYKYRNPYRNWSEKIIKTLKNPTKPDEALSFLENQVRSRSPSFKIRQSRSRTYKIRRCRSRPLGAKIKASWSRSRLLTHVWSIRYSQCYSGVLLRNSFPRLINQNQQKQTSPGTIQSIPIHVTNSRSIISISHQLDLELESESRWSI